MVIKKLKSFTLIELLIATAIFTVVMVSVYSAFQSGLFGYRNISASIDTYQSARLILERMNKDIRNSFAYSENNDTRFSGSAGEISFLALVDTYKGDKLGRDFAFVKYSLSDNKLMRLCRKGADALNNNSEETAQQMKDNVTKLSFSYFNYDDTDKSLKETAGWTDPKKLPAAVKITLGIKNKDNEEEFERTVYLPKS